MSSHDFLAKLGLEAESPGAAAGPFLNTTGEVLTSIDPATNTVIASIRQASAADYETVVSKACEAYDVWRTWPAPKRGEIVRQIGDALREHKDDLGRLVSLETGKIYQEGLGEVQEMIDICDFAVGLSRQLYGLTMHSERPGHRMYEQWHPIGTVGIISAFNFPVAVWAWNAMLAFVCGDACVWKPSEFAPLCAIAVQKLTQEVLARNDVPEGLSGLLIGSLEDVAQPLTEDRRIPLISATGSCRMGKIVNQVVAARLGRCLLELGGNNAIVVRPSADVDMAIRGILFGAVGTAGQRCTTTRRVFLHSEVAGQITERLVEAYGQVKIGNPLDEGTLVGPLVHKLAVEQMMSAIVTAKSQGGEVLVGGEVYTEGACAEGNFVLPTIVKATKDMEILQTETFAPLLYLVEVDDLEEAIALNNNVPQGLSSAIFTRDLLEAERFLSALGSDCGIANVNIGTSGAEIGGAFGGEKETGGGREAGSDSWRAYMRRQTCTINYSTELPLAQGISFG
ncbi:MAG: aldehyde dehydrogenase family protein [Planctomycetes bacterium]|nr:aldehyde dehydrogenase family protein [Planctomycetota bacterium]